VIDVDKLRQVFRTALGLSPDAPVDELRYQAVDQWDSLAHMSLVAALEDAFDIMIDTDEVIGLDSFARAQELLEREAARA